ncbi:MAG TPA: hypothetical protein VK483_10340 [Chitinophagaceae bacterium]|nr:hypothetical protein [Chitinophagaceae bacterium]
MKTRHLLVAVLVLFGTALQAQTKKIAFESHSGSPENFNIALGNEIFDNDESDYGLPPDKSAYKLDRVILISDSVSVLVSKEYKRPWGATSDSADKFVQVKRDTVYNDPLFNRKNSSDSILKGIKERAKYETSNKTKFIGLDNKKNETKKTDDRPQQQLIPFAITNDPPNNNPPFDMQLIMMLGTILLLSLLGGWLSWRFYQPRLQPGRA